MWRKRQIKGDAITVSNWTEYGSQLVWDELNLWSGEQKVITVFYITGYYVLFPLNIQGIKYRQNKSLLKWCFQYYLSIRCKTFSFKEYSMNFLQYRASINFIFSHSIILSYVSTLLCIPKLNYALYFLCYKSRTMFFNLY